MKKTVVNGFVTLSPEVILAMRAKISQLEKELKFWKEHAETWEAFGMNTAAELQNIQRERGWSTGEAFNKAADRAISRAEGKGE